MNYSFFFSICQDCDKNSSNCLQTHCESTNNQKGIILANRQFPAPAIQVCHNDILVVDVINNIPGYGLSIHWRGQPNNEAPFMDGVPMVTQCAIPSFTTFQYKFRASSPGTHFYHAFSDRDRNRGLFGALVVREADKADPFRALYEEDLKEHVILLSEWTSDDGKQHSVLINGKGLPNTGKEVFKVQHGKNYRFRVAYAASISTCPVVLTVEDHPLTIIALDGNPVQLHESSSVIISKGERIDFILKAWKKPKSYLFKVESQCEDPKVIGTAFFAYDNTKTIRSEYMWLEKAKETEKLSNKLDSAPEMKHLNEMDSSLQTDEVDQKFYLGYDYKYYEDVTVAGEYCL